jgi:glycosidase
MDLLNGRFLKGPNMYGQDVNHQNPTVRAILLEMQRRKNNTGVDGIRVDGAQDFKFFNPLSGRVEYDDNYLNDMAEVQQDMGDHKRQLFAIFEDGRPWPAEGWEEISTYRDIVEYRPDAFQWGAADLCPQHPQPDQILGPQVATSRRTDPDGSQLDHRLR